MNEDADMFPINELIDKPVFFVITVSEVGGVQYHQKASTEFTSRDEAKLMLHEVLKCDRSAYLVKYVPE